MSSKIFSKIFGKFLLYLSALITLPLAVSILYEFFIDKKILLPHSNTAAFLITFALTAVLGASLLYNSRGVKESVLHRKWSILLVVVIWIVTPAICALPFLLTRVIENPVDAYFEAMSGLTTTGVTIIEPKLFDESTGLEMPIIRTNPQNKSIVYQFYGTVSPVKDSTTGFSQYEGIEALGKPLLFWRALLEWIGGIGIVVLFLTVLPTLSMGGRFLFESEVSGPTKEGILPRVKETVTVLWKVYLGLTLLLIVILMATDAEVSLFEATTLAMTTISTGGFTIYNGCFIGILNTSTILAIMVFMILGGLNFSLYYYAIKRKFQAFRQPELYYYFLILFIGSLLVSLGLWLSPSQNGGEYSFSPSQAFMYGSFQAISALTSTGFTIISYDYWPMSCQLILIVLMYIGGMSGSTAGGIKVIRFIIAWRVMANKIESFFRPEVVRLLKVGNREISDKVALSVFSIFTATIFFVGLGSYLLILDGIDPITSFTLISTLINNNGLYIGGVGCLASVGYLSTFAKILGIIWMALGRLEYFSLLAILLPSFWKK